MAERLISGLVLVTSRGGNSGRNHVGSNSWRAVVAAAAALGAAVFGASPSLAAAPGGVLLSCPAPSPGTTVRWVGSGQTYSSLGAAVSAANAGDTICMVAGTYQNAQAYANINKPLTIVGVGGYAHLEGANGWSPPDGKALLTISKDVTIKGLEFSGATVSDRNGAGIRWEGGALTIDRSYFHNNENGILGGGTTITVTNSRFVDNGFGDGQSHGMYLVGNKTVVDSTYFEGTNVGHNLKSLAPETIVTNSTFEDGLGGPGHVPSYSIDLPAGSKATIRNNTFIQRDAQGNPGAVNAVVIHYDHTQASPALQQNRLPDSLVVDNNTFRNYRQNGILVSNGTTATAEIAGNRVTGVATTIKSGLANVTGNLVGLVAPSAAKIPAPTRVDDFANGLALSGGAQSLDGIQGNSSMTALGSTIYVSNRYQGVGVFDRLTGTSTLYHGPQDIEALGNDGTHLLAGTFTRDEVYKMATDGTVLGTIALQVTKHLGITGLDSDGSRLFVGSYDDGNVHVFNTAGAELGVIATGIGGGVLSGLSIDRGDGTLWLTTGFGDGSVFHFEFDSGFDARQIGWYDLVPIGSSGDIPILTMLDHVVIRTSQLAAEPQVAEPGAIAIFAAALGGLLMHQRRRAAAAAG